MKQAKNFVFESLMLNESFGGDLAKMIVTSAGDNKNGYYSLWRHYKWSEITDDDLERMDAASAKKLAYKQSGDFPHIFWMEGDKTIASSVGNFTFTLYGQYCRSYGKGGFRSVKAISEQADYAYVLKDPKRFETKELLAQRREAKAGATALLKAEEVRQENIDRYERMKAKMKLEKTADVATMMSKLEQITKEYTEAITKLCTVGSERMKDKATSMNKLNSAYGKVTDFLRSALSVIEDSEKEYTTTSWLSYGTKQAKQMEDAINDLRTLIGKELAKFDDIE